MFDFKKLVVSRLREAAERIDAGNSEITESEAMDILRVVSHESLSKEQACRYLNNSSRSNFDALVREGKIPKGRKITGFKELRWYKDDLDVALYRMEKEKKGVH